MRRVTWLLENELPIVRVRLREPMSGAFLPRTLLADTGAGPRLSPFELVLSAGDTARFGNAKSSDLARVTGAIDGRFEVWAVWVEIPGLAFARWCNVLSVPGHRLPDGAQGIATFRFLNSFTYGNFGEPREFGLELLPLTDPNGLTAPR